MQKRFLETGKIVSTHGIKGEVRAQCWSDSPEFLSQFKRLYLDQGKTELKVRCRPHKNISIIKIEGIDRIEDTADLINKVIYIDRNDAVLEEGTYFIQDIIGLEVRDIQSDCCYGKVTDVFSTGANDVYEMRDQNGRLFYIPVIDDIVKEKDFEKGAVYIKNMKGLFDGNSDED